jgi:hypothetical protein
VDEASVDAVVEASVGTIEGASMMTVLVDVEVRPLLSVATWSMVSVATVVVSSWTGFIGAPLTNVVMPRLRSPCGPLMVAPRSV